jgi:ADP-heptose:LPS heptosyltransferase
LAERILITRLRYMGDVVLTTPCVRALKDRFPDSRIDYLTQTPFGEILLNNPYLNDVISLDVKSAGTAESARLMWRLARTRYDLAIDLLSNPRSALLTAATAARRRVGTYHLSRSWAYNVNVRVRKHVRSAVEHHLEHLRRAGIGAQATSPEVFASKEERRLGEGILRRAGLGAPSLAVLIQPGAKWQAKRWPLRKFEELALLVARQSMEVAFLAGPGEEQYVRGNGLSRKVPLISGLNVRELVCVLAAAGAYVGNDGGPAHVAAALGTRTVVLFGPSEPDIWFPYGYGSRAVCIYDAIECRPCHLHDCEHVRCLEAISAERVLGAVCGLMSGKLSGTGLVP